VGSLLYTSIAPSLPTSLSIVMAAADSSSSSASDDDSLSDMRTRLLSSLSQSCSLPGHAASLISTSLKYTAEDKKDVVALAWCRHADGMELNECPLFTLDADQDINLFCATDFCISLNNFKFGSPRAIEHFAQALVEKIWLVQGKEIAADPTGWLVCSPAYRFVPVSAVLLSRRVHKLLADRCVEERPANQAPALLELYRDSITAQHGVDYASLGPEARKKVLPSFSVRGPPRALRGKRVIAIDDTRIYGVHALRSVKALSALGCTAVYHFFLLVATQAVLERGCDGGAAEGRQASGGAKPVMQVEDRLNMCVVSPADDDDMFCGWADLQSIILEDGFTWTMRPVTWLMRRPTLHLAVVVKWLAETKPSLLRDLRDAVREESLHQKHPEGAALLEEAANALCDE
jgi:hypothetical protein